jgi:hypothetical protein
MILAQQSHQNSDKHRDDWIEDITNHQRELHFAVSIRNLVQDVTAENC